MATESNQNYIISNRQSDDEKAKRTGLLNLLNESPIAQSELLAQLGVYIPRPYLSRIIYLYELYRKIIDVHGVVMEFGVRWGQNMSLFSNFRGMLEPFNYNRSIIGFDTFSGFPNVTAEDGSINKAASAGGYGVADSYEEHLAAVLDHHESQSPISHIRKYELVKGDATEEIVSYLGRNPHTVVALAYFDFDLYLPTKICLQAILPHLTKGSILAFDEVNNRDFPGETIALKEVLGGLDRLQLMRSPLSPSTCYGVWQG